MVLSSLIRYFHRENDALTQPQGAGSTSARLVQESGVIDAPFTTDFLLPVGNFSWYAHTSGGEYSTTQFKDVAPGGIPYIQPPYPEHFGALRTEPVIFVGYSVINNPNMTQPLTRDDPEWNNAWTPKILACEHRETKYVANFTYTGETQTATAFSTKTYGPPIINTTYLRTEMAMDGTEDNTTAIPESNYVYPNDTARYRRVAAYHSLGKMLRSFIVSPSSGTSSHTLGIAPSCTRTETDTRQNGTVQIPAEPGGQPNANTQVGNTSPIGVSNQV